MMRSMGIIYTNGRYVTAIFLSHIMVYVEK